MLVGYVARRLLGAIPVLIGVSAVVFLAMQLVPGDIAKALLGPLATPETVAEFRHYLGLDRPIPEQYASWLWRALHGDLGRSFSSNMPVSELLGDRLRNSAILLAGSLVIAIPLGVGEDTQPEHLVRHPLQPRGVVTGREPHQEQVAAGDAADHPPVDPNLRTRDALEDDPHSTVTDFARLRG